MITHNKPLPDQLQELVSELSLKAHEHNDPELHTLTDDALWMVEHEILPLVNHPEQDYTYDEAYDKGFEDGYEEAKERALDAL